MVRGIVPAAKGRTRPKITAGKVQKTITKKNKPANPPRKKTANGPRRVVVPNFLDPMVQTPAPTHMSSGKALPHTGLVSKDFILTPLTASAGGDSPQTLLIVTNSGVSGTVGYMCRVGTDGTIVADTTEVLTIPSLAAGPTAMRAMKFSVSVVNCTNALKRGGRVTYINSSQRLPGGDQFGAGTIAAIKSSPYRRRITADDLVTPMQLVGYPIDATEYHSFQPFGEPETPGNFLFHVTNEDIRASTTGRKVQRPMSVVAFVFDHVADVQEYSVTIRASYYTRWPLDSVPGMQMKNIPVAKAEVINAVHNKAEDTAHDLVKVAEGGAMAALAPRAVAAARGAGGLGGAIGRAIGGIAGGVAEAEGVAAAAAPLLAADLGAAAPLVLVA